MAKDLKLYPAEKKGALLELDSIDDLKEMARQVRRDIVRMLAMANSGHTGGSLGMADIFTALYFRLLLHKPHEFWEKHDLDMVFLSNGHIAPVWYSVLARAGYFSLSELNSLRQVNSYLQGHPTSESKLPGIRIASGSLGQGLSAAVGAALGLRMDGKKSDVFCLMGDGECQEGQIWEAAMSAAHYGLGNLIGIVDYNNLQIDGEVTDVMSVEPFADKWRAFGWDVYHCNGNDIEDFVTTIEKLRAGGKRSRPSVVLATTVMGKGVHFFEGTMPDNSNWHGKPPSKDDAVKALAILGETVYGDF
ncbi:transketolase [Chlorobium sp. BLA1]|uniref:transketolase n=1 Tax=Candidatus Chlorobium masyuteum TaxID=2716876 RepID=UPI00141F1868|nr:transketolase [Candidatus Chlorobium masyuteum]NHQ60321.1 transketolase [Candidatus Chlorobium masyuteum]NTU44107.1 transketolase [Chlorobiaceae bacterium]